jgi:hypothetical protein
MLVILTGVRWNLSVVLLCISLTARMVSIFSCVFLALCTSSFEKFCLVQLPNSLLVH